MDLQDSVPVVKHQVVKPVRLEPAPSSQPDHVLPPSESTHVAVRSVSPGVIFEEKAFDGGRLTAPYPDLVVLPALDLRQLVRPSLEWWRGLDLMHIVHGFAASVPASTLFSSHGRFLVAFVRESLMWTAGELRNCMANHFWRLELGDGVQPVVSKVFLHLLLSAGPPLQGSHSRAAAVRGRHGAKSTGYSTRGAHQAPRGLVWQSPSNPGFGTSSTTWWGLEGHACDRRPSGFTKPGAATATAGDIAFLARAINHLDVRRIHAYPTVNLGTPSRDAAQGWTAQAAKESQGRGGDRRVLGEPRLWLVASFHWHA
mmetsp:Transcript_19969/g.58332  ORF Transcript_19969/g.58332 Transcript_19969/m.58332 type:complete len:313 (+) Transcript_19969:2124-3062(+)